MTPYRRLWLPVLLSGAALSIFSLSAARAETIELFAAGSLRGVVAELSKATTAAFNVEIKPSFGGSGAMRERIEKGEKPDLFLSADVGSPQQLERQGRTVIPAIAFARNRMCIVSRRTAGVTRANLIEKLLAKDLHVKTSTPIADPSGDYAWAIFDRIEQLKPGSGAILKEKAQSVMTVTAPPTSPTQSAAAALFASHQIDMSITYCSGSGALEKEVPELTSFEVPARLDPHPLYGMAVLSTNPQALRVALFLMSQKGQDIIAAQGLVPILDKPAVVAK